MAVVEECSAAKKRRRREQTFSTLKEIVLDRSG
jgi:hypothetical protein